MSARENRFLLKEPTSTISYYNLSSIDNGIGKNKTPALHSMPYRLVNHYRALFIALTRISANVNKHYVLA